MVNDKNEWNQPKKEKDVLVEGVDYVAVVVLASCFATLEKF